MGLMLLQNRPHKVLDLYFRLLGHLFGLLQKRLDSDKDFIESVDLYGEYCCLNNVRSPGPWGEDVFTFI